MKVRPLDVVVVLWVATCVWLGSSVREQVNALADATGSVERIGRSVEATGRVLQGVGDIPLVGGEVADAGAEIVAGGREAQAVAREGRVSGRELGNLLLATISLVPTLPLLVLYLPLRWRQERERRALAGASEALLADRARVHLPLDVVIAIADDPAALAAAERRRLGLSQR